MTSCTRTESDWQGLVNEVSAALLKHDGDDDDDDDVCFQDVVAVKAFWIKEDLYLAMTRYIGDSKVLRWTAKEFSEVQALPSRGSMILQPFSFKERYYLALGSDYTFSQVYLWDAEEKVFERFKEVYIMAPRSFTVVSTDRRDFLFASSFKGSTQILEHIIIDLSL